MTLCSSAFSHCSAPGHSWVKPCGSKSDCFRYTLFDSPASAGGLGRRASSSSWLSPRRSPMGRTAASCLCPKSVPWPDTQIISSGLADLSDTGLLRVVRAVIASPLANKMYSLDFSWKPTNMPDSILSSAFVRSVNGPTRCHNRSPNAHLPMWCPRPRHRSERYLSIDPTVSRFSIVQERKDAGREKDEKRQRAVVIK